MSLIQRIDALLPQTQCGKCGHPGCRPYAEGIAQGEAINKCPPGGRETIAQLAELLQVPEQELDTERGTAPAQIAYIREAECIGCTKCIQACPVDAIVGAAKLMHTVLIDECTGCDLCIAPCPVDCIEMHPLASTEAVLIVGGWAADAVQLHARTAKRNQARQRYEQRTARLRREEEHKLAERQARAHRAAQPQGVTDDPVQSVIERIGNQQAAADAALKKAKVDLAMSRAQLNKSLKAFGHPPIAEQAAQLVQMQQQFEAAERALAELEQSAPAPAPKDSVLKRAKIQLALHRAELSKARSNGAPEEQLTRLSLALAQAEQDLHAAEQASAKPAPDLVRIEKRPIDSRLRQLKTELAYARADLNKLQRSAQPSPQQLEQAQHRLLDLEKQVAAHAAP